MRSEWIIEIKKENEDEWNKADDRGGFDMSDAEQIASLEDTIKYKDIEIKKLIEALHEARSFIDDIHYNSYQVNSTIKKILR